MAILIRVNGNETGEGFLIAPDGTRTFPVSVGLRLDAGAPVSATLQAAPDGAGLSFSTTSVNISTTETFVEMQATAPSASRNDTVLEVVVSGSTQASFNLTAIVNPQVWFKGRFQARFAIVDDFYNEPRGSSASFTFALEGEPDFVPADSVPTTIDKPVGRNIRFHNPIAPRSQADPIEVSVISIKAVVGGTLEEFTVGDSVIGLPVNLGPDTYFAGNMPVRPGDPLPAEDEPDGYEILALFEFHVGDLFSGSSLAADRPKANGAASLTTGDKTQYGIGTLSAFNTTRKTALLGEFNGLSAAQQAATVGRNLKTRIKRLGGHSSIDGGSTLDGDGNPLVGSPSFAWNSKMTPDGLINDKITFQPSNSTVLAYLAGYGSFNFNALFFNFHTDALSGQVHGHIKAITTDGVTPFQNGVYDIDSRDASPFNALNVQQMTTANIDAALGASPTSERAVVTLSPDYDRLVVSKAVVATPNPADPTTWTVTSRGESLVGEFLPDASVFPRDLVYLILPPGHQANVLGTCEGTAFTPAPAVGFARLFDDGTKWRLLLHAGTNGGSGVTYRGEWAGSAATIPVGCTPQDVELLTPTLDFGSVEEGMAMFRQVLLLNRSPSPVTVSLPALFPPPFGAAGATSVTIDPGEVGSLGISFTAGAPGPTINDQITLLTAPPIASTLTVMLSGTPVDVQTVDVVLVLDRSSSMNEPALNEPGRFISKAVLRNEAAQVFVDLLRPADRIGMVRFNQDAQPHMALQEAGAEMGGAGRLAAATALASANLNPSGSTSVGDGMFEANAMLTAPSGSLRHAFVVLTDGKENQPQYISDISLGANVKAYAIGLGVPQEVNVDKLSAVTGNTGGYLLVTGALDAANEFRLHKYYAQILTGVHGDSVVLDPPGVIKSGEVQRLPFFISEADSHFDVVLLTRSSTLRITLEAPDGTRIDPSNAVGFNGQFVEGRACRYYRMSTPAFPGDFTRGLGKWHIVIDYPGQREYRGAFRQTAGLKNVVAGRNDNREASLTNVTSSVTTYNVLVRARSAIQMEARIEQRGFNPGFERTAVAYLRAFGQPLAAGVNLFAQVTRPDGLVSVLPMQHMGHGRFEAPLADAKMLGTYDIVIRAAGLTPGNFPLQREQTLSGIVIDPAADNPVDGRVNEIVDVLKEQQETLKNLTQQMANLLSDSQPGAQPGPPPGAGVADVLGKWLLWILIVLILILLLTLWGLLKS